MSRKNLLIVWGVWLVTSLILLVLLAGKDLVGAVVLGSLTLLWTIAGLLSLVSKPRVLFDEIEFLTDLLVFANWVIGLVLFVKMLSVYSGVNLVYWLVSGLLIMWTISRVPKRKN